jgi:hypothetical protein
MYIGGGEELGETAAFPIISESLWIIAEWNGEKCNMNTGNPSNIFKQ